MPTHRTKPCRSTAAALQAQQPQLLELETFLPYQLAVTAAAVSQALAGVYGERFGLTVADWRVLANLGRFGAMNAGDLATRSNLDKPKVTRTLRTLKARRLISRTTAPADRRRLRIALTAAGTTLFAAATQLAREWEAELVATLADSERALLDRTLAELRTRAQALSQGSESAEDA